MKPCPNYFECGQLIPVDHPYSHCDFCRREDLYVAREEAELESRRYDAILDFEACTEALARIYKPRILRDD